MASTRKGSKKMGGAAKSSKKAAAGSTRKAGATKASKKAGAIRASKKAATKGGPGGNVTHPPVIVDDGSAAIRLHENTYRRTPSGGSTHVSTHLKLLRVEASREHTPGAGDRECIALKPNESAVITFSTRVGSSPPVKSFTIRGGNSNNPADSPVLDFDHGIFPRGNPDPEGRRIFRNPNRTIISMEIVTSGGRKHDCSVVKGQPGFHITFHDDHVDDL